MNQKSSIARSYFISRVRKSLLGPGAEEKMWNTDINEELLSDFPLVRYYSGVLFPQKTNPAIEKDQQKNNKKDLSNHAITDTFHPSSCGLTICLERSCVGLNVEISFGLYYIPIQRDIKVRIDESDYNQIVNSQNFPLKDVLKYENNSMFFAHELSGNKQKDDPSGDYKLIYDFIKSKHYNEYPFSILRKLVGRAWKRKEINSTLNIDLTNLTSRIDCYKDCNIINGKGTVCATLYINKIIENDKLYLKLILENSSTPQSNKRFSNHDKDLNRKCFFQVGIKVFSNSFRPYNDKHVINCYDDEANTLDLIYRDVKNYGIGHNCSVAWDTKSILIKEIETTFSPEYDMNEVMNSFNKDTLDEASLDSMSEFLNIRNLSIFSMQIEKIIPNLREFVDQYANWIKQQKNDSKSFDEEYSETAKRIIDNLDYNLERLRQNIELLNEDRILRAFTLANTAMYIQIIISNDDRFAKKEKYLKDFKETNIYNDLSFFEKYKSDTEIAYRPFQLAFLILNIGAIVDEKSEQRNSYVDLIWFPTGGGKTEAYLAVSALAIIWRRLSTSADSKDYNGTSVIMRYTLRLLTSQQFDRATKLIASLDFLRKNFIDELKSTFITIGLWLGESSTPNKIAKAGDIIDKIDSEASKRDKGNPEIENVFQVRACPWCGAKLVNKHRNTGEWNVSSFIMRNNSFFLKCPNEHCPFNTRMPVQVVDEMLYKEPPTLLFATVDKFAMLAWQSDGNKFFNSLPGMKGLAPDLIIQDELHLLSGALGSTTAFFESVVEMLATKNGKKPKIIASTATTRNTRNQIEQLYGKRKVNIFPPTGLSYKDSFFAKESKISKRKYLGFLPTGKSAIDTQIRILSNLLAARTEAFNNPEISDVSYNNYSTIVSYYNSLKDVGRISNMVNTEILNYYNLLNERIYYDLTQKSKALLNYKELTSRENSYKIKHTLSEIEKPIIKSSVSKKNDAIYKIDGLIDLILATNMISVGIDISRLNIMMINGQPKNIAEYIQASSRVGRRNDGLVLTLFDPKRSREKSYFENFLSFHQAFYKKVEPLSLTPSTESIIDKMLMTLVVTYVRHIVGLNKNNKVTEFKPSCLDNFRIDIEKRFGNNQYLTDSLKSIENYWLGRINDDCVKKYKDKDRGLLISPRLMTKNEKYLVMQSMREVDPLTFINIRDVKAKFRSRGYNGLYVDISSRKVVSAYGGVGSLFETPNGTVLILPFDDWTFTKQKIIKESELSDKYFVEDDRLLARLSHSFINLKKLFVVPENTPKQTYKRLPEIKEDVICAKYFPEWFYCKRCRSFRHIKKWYKEWLNVFPQGPSDKERMAFQEPKCAKCYLSDSKGKNGSTSKALYNNSKYNLEQVRLIMTSPDGKIKDLPWDYWNNMSDFNSKMTKCCDKQDLEYIQSGAYEDYSGIKIKCRNCNKERTLSGVFGYRSKVNDKKDVFFKTVVKSSNSVYYPIIFNSLCIPKLKKENLPSNYINKIKKQEKYSVEELADLYDVSPRYIRQIQNDEAKNDEVFVNEESYRYEEYEYILSEDHNDQYFISKDVQLAELLRSLFKKLIQIKKLKMVSVETAYTRQEPFTKDDFLSNENSSLKCEFTSKFKLKTQYLPAIESYGEGIFFELDLAAIEKCYTSHKEDILTRIDLINKNIENSNCKDYLKFEGNIQFYKYLVLHTLSHLLIKELEFLCGYSTTSINERIYSNSKMQGVLIYTIAGSEGSYGGLISQCSDNRFNSILKSALERARNCSSDPICYQSKGQGSNGKNLAACYNCALLPETSCEQFNTYLDRAVLIDEKYGFFA